MKRIKSLDELKKIELYILKHIDYVCKKNNLRYYLVGGTLLGAVRHKGFIPWDDDIDIAMSRRDLMILADNLDRSKYQIHMPTEEGYYYNYAKVVDINTTVAERGYRGIPGMGVWVDIFIIEDLKGDLEAAKKAFKELDSIRQKINVYATKPVIRKNVVSFIKSAILYYGLDIKQLPELQKEYIDKALYLSGDGQYIYFTGGAYGEKDIFPRELFESVHYLQFEDQEFMVPCGYDKYLRGLYNDYMKLPPRNMRKTRHSFIAYENRKE